MCLWGRGGGRFSPFVCAVAGSVGGGGGGGGEVFSFCPLL